MYTPISISLWNENRREMESPLFDGAGLFYFVFLLNYCHKHYKHSKLTQLSSLNKGTILMITLKKWIIGLDTDGPLFTLITVSWMRQSKILYFHLTQVSEVKIISLQEHLDCKLLKIAASHLPVCHTLNVGVSPKLCKCTKKN